MKEFAAEINSGSSVADTALINTIICLLGSLVLTLLVI